jgi:hypothetical protein
VVSQAMTIREETPRCVTPYRVQSNPRATLQLLH